jgi:hypothetical protein
LPDSWKISLKRINTLANRNFTSCHDISCSLNTLHQSNVFPLNADDMLKNVVPGTVV